MIAVTVTARVPITLPRAARDALGLKKGQHVAFIVADGRAYRHPVPVGGRTALRTVAAGRRSCPGRDFDRIHGIKRREAEHILHA